jgi:hypothetical protein
MAFEVEESIDILIEWDRPKPEIPLNLRQSEKVWYKRLKPMIRHPGRRARVVRDIESGLKARIVKQNIDRSLWGNDSYQNWKLETAKEDDGTWGLYATYLGRFSEVEHAARVRKREDNGARTKRNMRLAKLNKAERLRRSSLAASIRPPIVHPD